MPADITLVNLNMLFMRYGEKAEKERHTPLGCLYLVKALENAGFDVDFRDYQLDDGEDPFSMNNFLAFLGNPAPVIGLSCMANLLPFCVAAIKAIRETYPQCRVILGGVGSKSVEDLLLQRFPWIEIIARGEGEHTAPDLLRTLQNGGSLRSVHGISFRENGHITHTVDRARIVNLDTIPFPAFDAVDLSRYQGHGMVTSRGCPYPCTFCSVAPVWDYESYSRSPANIVEEMRLLYENSGVDLFLFQDEFFISTKAHVMEFCRLLQQTGLPLSWKAFGRVNLVDEEMMQAMADSGCLELRFGIESGSPAVLERIKKGFTAEESLDIVSRAIPIFPRVDAFYVWGFPFETMEDFQQTLFQMVSLRMLGARILPSLLSLLPQTPIYKEYAGKTALEFCPYLLPEFVITGHEVCLDAGVNLPEKNAAYFALVKENPDIFPGFFHIDLQNNVLPKLTLLQEYGFYGGLPDSESCGAHSPKK